MVVAEVPYYGGISIEDSVCLQTDTVTLSMQVGRYYNADPCSQNTQFVQLNTAIPAHFF